jgi:hypothetical protein
MAITFAYMFLFVGCMRLFPAFIKLFYKWELFIHGLFFLYPKLIFACESLSSTVFTTPNWQQGGVNNYFNSIIPDIKPFQQVLKSHCNRCKAVSTLFVTVSHNRQTSLSKSQTHFSRSVMSFQQLLGLFAFNVSLNTTNINQ